MALNSYVEVQRFINGILTRNISSQTNQPEINDVPASPHGAFWNLPYDQFVNGNVPGVKDPVTKQPMKILIKGNSAKSNIVLALSGMPGTVFDPDPNNGDFGQMPPNGPPMFSPQEIKQIADWIDSGCPQ